MAASTILLLNDTATTEIYTLSLHDALPIYPRRRHGPALPPPRERARPEPRSPPRVRLRPRLGPPRDGSHGCRQDGERSEEHTSELQSRQYLVCRLLLEKKTNYSSLLDSP